VLPCWQREASKRKGVCFRRRETWIPASAATGGATARDTVTVAPPPRRGESRAPLGGAPGRACTGGGEHRVFLEWSWPREGTVASASSTSWSRESMVVDARRVGGRLAAGCLPPVWLAGSDKGGGRVPPPCIEVGRYAERDDGDEWGLPGRSI